MILFPLQRALVDTATSFVKLIEELRDARLAEAKALGALADAIATRNSGPVALPPGSPAGPEEETCYLSANQLAKRIPYSEHTIRNMVSSGELIEGEHYFRRRRRVMFSWPAMRNWVEQQTRRDIEPLPLVRNRTNGPISATRGKDGDQC